LLGKATPIFNFGRYFKVMGILGIQSLSARQVWPNYESVITINAAIKIARNYINHFLLNNKNFGNSISPLLQKQQMLVEIKPIECLTI